MKLYRCFLALSVLLASPVVFVSISASRGSDLDNLPFETVKARADKGDIDAQMRLAAMYASGEGVARDPGKAFKIHRKAAEQGSARAQCLLGLDYADGAGVKKNMTEAVKWLQRSADQGWPSAQYDLGLCYANGDAPGKGANDAAQLFRKAAEQGLADGQWMLGQCYLEGVGAPKDVPEGVRWTRLAAEQGLAQAQRTLGICYAKGTGVGKDYIQAYKWLDLAAGQDSQHTDDIKVNLSMAERFMTPEQIVEGQRLAREFKPQKSPAVEKMMSGTWPVTNATPLATSAASAPHTSAVTSASARTGTVEVKTEDESSEIFVDAEFVGNAPAKLKLAVGSHVVEVKKPGFKTYRKELKVGEGSELTLRVVLEKQ